jgi:predicted nucleic acid-binding protein
MPTNSRIIDSSDCARVFLDTTVLFSLLNPRSHGEPHDTVHEIIRAFVNTPPTNSAHRTFVISSINTMESTHYVKSQRYLEEGLRIITESQNFEVVQFTQEDAFWVGNNLGDLLISSQAAELFRALNRDDMPRKPMAEWVKRDMMILASCIRSKCELMLTDDRLLKEMCDRVGQFCVLTNRSYWYFSGGAATFDPNTTTPHWQKQGSL